MREALDVLPITPVQPLPARCSVLGLGRTGIAVTRFLCSRNVDVICSDVRDHLPEGIEKELKSIGAQVVLGRNEIRAGDLVVISPGISPQDAIFEAAHAMGSAVISEPELFARSFGKPIVAVTGTDGKSTVTTWLAHLLMGEGVRVCAGGNLGNPLVEELERDDLDLAILEISAFQLITTHSLVPALALVTNIADDHLDYFGGERAAYVAAKQRIMSGCGVGTTLVLPEEDSIVSRWEVPSGAKVHSFAMERGENSSGWRESDALFLQLEPSGQAVSLLPVYDLPLVGEHNQANALQVSIAASVLGLSIDAIRRGLRSYQPLPHRCAVVCELDGVQYINDSKATSPNATTAALRGVERPIVLIVGGSDKGADFGDLGDAIGLQTKAVVLLGETRDRIRAVLPPGHPSVMVDSMMEAVQEAALLAVEGDCVLLSPACASFDQYESYAERGRAFEGAVKALSTD